MTALSNLLPRETGAAMANESFESIWDAICDSPEEAAEWKHRSALMMRLRDYLRTVRVPLAEIAVKLGVAEAKLLAVMRGRIGEIPLAELEGMVGSAQS